jgi:hypothetical protein
MLGVLGAVVISDLVRWWYYRPQPLAFVITVRCAIVGAIVTVTWVVFLLASGSWSGFVSYYLGTISGHELWGAFAIEPFSLNQLNYFVYAYLPVALFLLTIWRFVYKLRSHLAITSREWVLGASAAGLPLFYPVFLDRPDLGHAIEIFAAATPMVLLWGIEFLEWVDRTIGSVVWSRLRSRRTRPTVQPTFWAHIASLLALGTLIGWYSGSPNVFRVAANRFQPHVSNPPVAGIPLGYQLTGETDVQQILDLRTVLKEYAGGSGPMFDFSNEMGVDYFLMKYIPGARYYHVEAAQTLQAQKEEVRDLNKSRPKVVIYFDTTFGIPLYDNIISSVRNYFVSQYLLDHYMPILDLKGQLIMIRNDLAASVPPPPVVSSPIVTSELYFQMPHCDWGYTPNFMNPPSVREIDGGDKTGLVEVTPKRFVIQPPPGSTWSQYRWIELDSDIGFRQGTVTITDLSEPGNTHDITFKTLPRTGNRLYVRVGSCIQWHGYSPGALTVLTSQDASGLSARLLR